MSKLQVSLPVAFVAVTVYVPDEGTLGFPDRIPPKNDRPVGRAGAILHDATAPPELDTGAGVITVLIVNN